MAMTGPLAFVLFAAGCVIPVDDAAAPVESVPEGILSTTTAPTTTALEPEPNEPAFELALYWNFDTGELARVIRRQDESPTVEQTLTALINGPSESETEAQADIGVILPRVVESLAPVAAPPDSAGVVVITVSDDFGLRQNDDAKIPIAEELVCTVTQFGSVTAVIIADSTGAIPLPDQNSEPIEGAAGPENYGNCEPAAEPTPTTDEG